MNVAIRHETDFAALARRLPAFAPLADVNLAPVDYRAWERRGGHENGRGMQIIHVAFIGKSGYGKSSLVNAIVGREVMETSAVDACTRKAQNATFRIRGDYFLSFADVPGIGESAERDAEYLSMYDTLVGLADVVVHVLRADCRDYAIDQDAFGRLFPDPASRGRVILALNGCDKIEPLSRHAHGSPSPAQLAHVRDKIEYLGERFPGVHGIVPCCANPAWNLAQLTNTIAALLLAAPGMDVGD